MLITHMNEINFLALFQVRCRRWPSSLAVKCHNQIRECAFALSIWSIHRHVLIPERHLISTNLNDTYIKAAFTAQLILLYRTVSQYLTA